MPAAATSEKIRSAAPQHVAIIMDGNGRWAKQRRRPRAMGHRAGQASVEACLRAAREHGVRYLTLFAFSSENWSRPQDEVDNLMQLFVSALEKKLAELIDADVRLQFIGELDRFPDEVKRQIRNAEQASSSCTSLIVTIAMGYGGRADIIKAARVLADRVKQGEITAAQISEAMFAAELSTANLPDPDLFIRTGGEKRISNFLLWNLSYTELYFVDTLWPDFDETEFGKAIGWFAGRERRFGQVTAE